MDAVHAGVTAEEVATRIKTALARDKTVTEVILVYRNKSTHSWRIMDLESATEALASYTGPSPPPEIVSFASLDLPDSIFDEWLAAQDDYMNYCESCGPRMDDEQEMRAATYEADVRRIRDRICDAVEAKLQLRKQ